MKSFKNYFFITMLITLFSCAQEKNYSTVSGKIIIDGKIDKIGKVIITKSWWQDKSKRKIIDINSDGSFDIKLDETDRYFLTFTYQNYQPIKLELDIPVFKEFECNINLKRAPKADAYFVSYRIPSQRKFKKEKLVFKDEKFQLNIEFPDSVKSVEYQFEDNNAKIPLDGKKLDDDGYAILDTTVNNNHVVFKLNDSYLSDKLEFSKIQNVKNTERFATLSNMYQALTMSYYNLTKSTKEDTEKIKPFLEYVAELYKNTEGGLKKELVVQLNTVAGLARVVDTYNEDFSKALDYGKANPDFAYNTRYTYWHMMSYYKKKETTNEELLITIDSLMKSNPITNGKIVDLHYTKFNTLKVLGKFDKAIALANSLEKNYPNSYFTKALKRHADAIDIVGKPAPEFTLMDENNRKINLSDFKGKYVFLDFWATWCLPCIQEFPNLQSTYEKIDTDKIAFVSICLDAEGQKLAEAKSKYKMNWFTLGTKSNLKSGVAKNYKLASLPTTYLIDKTGKIIAKNGKIGNESLLSTIQKKIGETITR